MERGAKYFLWTACIAAAWAGLLSSCTKTFDEVKDPYSARKVLIYYAAGFNNLAPNMEDDMQDMVPTLPMKSQSNKYKVIVVSHMTQKALDYATPTAPVIFDFYRDEYGNAVRDTLYTFPSDATLAQASSLKYSLEFIREKFPAKEYGMCLSSHGSGWVPDNYYTFPTYDKEEYEWSAPKKQVFSASQSGGEDPVVEDFFGSAPRVKSCFAHYNSTGKDYTALNIPEMASAIPFKLDYLLMDLCLMGCVEVAWELRDVVGKIVFSAMEVMSEGFDYTNLINHLLYSEPVDLKAVAEDTYSMYTSPSCWNPYCTIALVDCDALEPLSQECAAIIKAHRSEVDSLDGSKVQGFFRSNRHFFYDLEDVLVKAGATAEEQTALHSALDSCVLYKASTAKGALGSFDIKTFCGMSMCIPHMNSDYLNDYYRNLSWNKAVSLAE